MYKIKVGEVEYLLNLAAITCLRYRSLYNSSPVADYSDPKKNLFGVTVRILHCAIVENKPEFDVFARACHETEFFVLETMPIIQRLFDGDSKYISKKDDEPADEIDEFEILAQCNYAKIDFSLWHELPLFQIRSIANRYFRMKDPKAKKYVKMSDKQISKFYGGL